jgi:tRNA(Ile)-lysidine synthase
VSPAGDAATAITPAEADALFAPWQAEPAIVAAVSGGPDSLAMLVLLAGWAAAAQRPRLTIATVDHGLRPASADEAAHVRDVAHRFGLPARLIRLDALQAGTGLQARARSARYQALAALARDMGVSTLMTAHTLDDQAETVLMRMAAGSGVAGLAGIRSVSRIGTLTLARPFLAVAKARLVTTCIAHGLSPASDPSNTDTRFARARWRKMAPLLAREGLDATRLASLAARAAHHADAIAMLAEARLQASRTPGADGQPGLDAATLLAQPLALAEAALAAALGRSGAPETGSPLSEPDYGPRLKRLEATCAKLMAALAAGQATRLTLGGLLIQLDSRGRMTLQAEAPRRRRLPM